MDRLDAFLRGLELNKAMGLNLDPQRIDQLVADRLNVAQQHGGRRPTINYSDPTGNAASAAADRRKR